jgi:hypothetical protein
MVVEEVVAVYVVVELDSSVEEGDAVDCVKAIVGVEDTVGMATVLANVAVAEGAVLVLVLTLHADLVFLDAVFVWLL